MQKRQIGCLRRKGIKARIVRKARRGSAGKVKAEMAA